MSEALNLHDTTDASVWAHEFCKRFTSAFCEIEGKEGVMIGEDYEDTMIGWFANAIMTGVDSEARISADRIEALEAKLATCEKHRDAYAECDRIGTQAVRDLEAKLAKAVEALDMLVRDCEADYPPSHGAIKYFSLATLAEISSHNKGENHE